MNSAPSRLPGRRWLQQRRWRLAIVAGAGTMLVYFIVKSIYPAYRDHAWRANFTKGVLLATKLRDEITRDHGTLPVRQAPREIPPEGAILGGYVASDGSVVVRVLLDYPLNHSDATSTIVLRRWVNLLNGKLNWDCGITPDSYPMPRAPACDTTLPAPSRQ